MAAAESFDFIIVGAGIAGAAAGYFLSRQASILLIERESQPGYHATGRSAAIYSETYGNAPVRALTTGSRDFLWSPPPGFAEHPVLTPRGTLIAGGESQREAVERAFEESRRLVPSLRRLEQKEILERVPVLRPAQAVAGLLEPNAADIDVHALHQGYLRGIRAKGGRLVCDAEVLDATPAGGNWRLVTRAGTFAAPVVINAAGAWADDFAALAGAAPIGLVPKRRTVITFEAPAGLAIAAWPQLVDADERFYFKPDAGRILATPADETPSPPCDAQPEEMDVALCIERIEAATRLKVTRLHRKWAGLRSFVADRTPVVGFDPVRPGFFWLAGQGGYGMQTSAAMGRTVAALARGLSLPADLADLGLNASSLAPGRAYLAA